MVRTLFAALSLFVFVSPLRAQATVALPLNNLAGDRSLDWIGESVAETIADTLHAEGLVMLDRTDRAEAMKRLSLRPGQALSRASVVRLADELGASSAVHGSFEVRRPEGAKPTLTASIRVLDLRQLRQTDDLRVEGLLEDLGVLQYRLAWMALTSIFPTRAGDEAEFMSRRPSVRVDAIENYVRGLQAGDEAARHRHFTQAVRLDPNFSQPHFQLGLHYWEKEDYEHAAQWFRGVATSDPHYWQAQFYFGICRHYAGDYAAAETALRSVSQSVPLNEVFSNLGAAQLRLGKVNEAIANLEKALEGDTADPDYHFNLGYALWYAKRFDDAADRFRAVLERIPDDKDATVLLGYCLKKEPPRAGDPKQEGLERIQEEYAETVFRQLKSMLEKK